MANIYQNVINFVGGGQLWSNILHFKLTETGDHRADQYTGALQSKLETVIFPSLLGCLSEHVYISSQKGQKITGDGGPSVTKVYSPTDFPGTAGGDLGNTSENVCLEFPVLLNAKNVTGKIFISGITDDMIVNNVISDDIKSGVLAFSAALMPMMTLSGTFGQAQYVIFNRANGFFIEPTFAQVGATVGSQRRRLRP